VNAVFDVLNVALFIGVTILLMSMYRETRQPGYGLLGVPLVLLPLLSLFIARWIKAAEASLSAGEGAAWPFSLVESGSMTLGSLLALWNGVSHIIWSAFVLLGLLMLRKQRGGEERA
jgi:hypothetical protein